MPSRAALDKWASQDLDIVGFNDPDRGVKNAAGPVAPTKLVATPGASQVSVAFTKPASVAAITTYQFSINGGAWTNRQTGTTASPVVITGLTPSVQVSIRLRAVTAAGNGDASVAVTATPTA